VRGTTEKLVKVDEVNGARRAMRNRHQEKSGVQSSEKTRPGQVATAAFREGEHSGGSGVYLGKPTARSFIARAGSCGVVSLPEPSK